MQALNVSVNGFHVQNRSSRVSSDSSQFRNKKGTACMIGTGRDAYFGSRLRSGHMRMELNSADAGSVFRSSAKSRPVKAQASDRDITPLKSPSKSSRSILPYVGVASLGAILFGYHLGYIPSISAALSSIVGPTPEPKQTNHHPPEADHGKLNKGSSQLIRWSRARAIRSGLTLDRPGQRTLLQSTKVVDPPVWRSGDSESSNTTTLNYSSEDEDDCIAKMEEAAVGGKHIYMVSDGTGLHKWSL